MIFSDAVELAPQFDLGTNQSIDGTTAVKHYRAPRDAQQKWEGLKSIRSVRSCIICTNVAESGVTIPHVGAVISSGVHRRVSVDVRIGVTMNALQTLSKSQMTQQMGRTGRTDEGDHITMMLFRQYEQQVRAQDLAQLDESDLTPMILRSLVSRRSSARTPFLCPPDCHAIGVSSSTHAQNVACKTASWSS